MRMAPAKLVANRPCRRFEIEGAALARDLRVKYDLKQKIAELVLEVHEILALDGIGDLVGFLDRVRRDARKGLLAVPRAAIGGAQPLHDGEQFLHR